MKLYHIVATSGDAMVIGNKNELPWSKYSEDLKFFKATTSGHTIIMGRKTFESIGQKPLPKRENFVLSRSNFDVPAGVKLFNSLDEAIKNASNETIFIIGGADLYQQTIDKADGIYLTKIEKSYPGDVQYPKIPSCFKKNEEKTKDLREKYGIDIIYLENTATV